MSGSTAQRGGMRHPGAVSLAIVASLYLLTLFVVEGRGFWAVDNANKFIQTRALVQSGYTEWSLPWEGRAIDPDFAFNPLPAPFSRVEDGRLFSYYPPFFAAVASVPWRLAGSAGLALLPLAGALLALLAVERGARGLGLGPVGVTGAVLGVGLATPLWFYSAVFWEHAPAAGLVAWGAVWLLRFLASGRRLDLVAASLCATFAIYFRDELYLFCAALLAVALLFSPGRRRQVALGALTSMALGILPLWIFQWLTLGHPLGFHASAALDASLAAHLRERADVAYALFVAFLPQAGASLLLALPFVGGFLLRPGLSRKALGRAVPAAASWALVCAVVVGIASWRAESPIAWLLGATGLFGAAPVLLLGFVRERGEPRAVRALWLLCLLYPALYTLVSPLASTGGVHWGNRLLLVLYPLLGLRAAAAVDAWLRAGVGSGRRPALGLAVVACALLASIALQLRGLELLYQKKRFSWALSEAITARPEPVVATAIWWAPQELHAAWFDKAIFLVDSETELAALLASLRGAGHRKLLYVVPPGDTSRGTLVTRLQDPLAFYSLDFLHVDLGDLGDVPAKRLNTPNAPSP